MKFRPMHIRLAFFAVSFAAMVYGYRALIFEHAPTVFGEAIEDMSYAYYVPLFSLYVLWTERKLLRDSVGEADWRGGFLWLFAFVAGFLGVRGTQIRLEIVGFAVMSIALAWLHFGRRTAKQVAFPALFLLFCMPLATYLDVVTVHLRLLAVSVSYAILKGVGVDVARVGTALVGEGGRSFAIDVAAPCSGLRSLFAMAALTAGYAYFNQATWARRAALFICSLPIAVAGNVARILSIALTAAYFDAEFATGFYHDYSGYVVFITAIALMLAVSGLIARAGERCGI